MENVLKTRDSKDFYEIYEYNGVKKIRILGYVYSAGCSVTKDPSQTYRKVDYESGLIFELADYVKRVSKDAEELQQLLDEAKQYIFDINEKEAIYYLDSFNELGSAESLEFSKLSENTPIGYYCNCCG